MAKSSENAASGEMLQSNTSGTDSTGAYPVLTIVNPSRANEPVGPATAPCSTSQKIMELLEEITGWQTEFQESRDSQLKRKMIGMENEAPAGSLSIVDMSPSWDVSRPTAHRGKCDALVSELETLLTELQETRTELTRTRSALAGLDPASVNQSEMVVDSFVPRSVFARERWDDQDFELVESAEIDECFGSESDFDVRQDMNDANLVAPPFDGWSLGGSIGIVNSIYVDWRVDSQENIAISVGKIESDFGTGDAESTIQIDPVTSEFFLQDDSELKSIFVWDSVAGELRTAERGCWTRLKKNDAIIASTFAGIDSREISASDQTASVSASSLASHFGNQLRREERILVLMKD